MEVIKYKLSVSKLFSFSLFLFLISSLFQTGCGGGGKQEFSSKSDSSLETSSVSIKSKVILGEYPKGMMAPTSVTVPTNIQSIMLEVFHNSEPLPFFSSTQNITSSTITIAFDVDLIVGETYNFMAKGYDLPNGPTGGGVITHSGSNSGVMITPNMFTVIIPLAQIATFTDAPVISNLPISSTNNTATITGLVNPQGSETIVFFEWGLTTATTLTRTPIINIGSGTVSIPVTYTLTGLQPNTSYFFNIIAEKSGHVVNQNNLFTTPLFVGANITFPQPPAIASTSASEATQTSVNLNASVLPGGSETLVYFEVGASPGLNDIMTSSVIRLNDLLWDNHSVSIPVTGLISATTYYYRVTALNSESNGLTTFDEVFTTL